MRPIRFLAGQVIALRQCCGTEMLLCVIRELQVRRARLLPAAAKLCILEAFSLPTKIVVEMMLRLQIVARVLQLRCAWVLLGIHFYIYSPSTIQLSKVQISPN